MYSGHLTFLDLNACERKRERPVDEGEGFRENKSIIWMHKALPLCIQ